MGLLLVRVSVTDLVIVQPAKISRHSKDQRRLHCRPRFQRALRTCFIQAFPCQAEQKSKPPTIQGIRLVPTVRPTRRSSTRSPSIVRFTKRRPPAVLSKSQLGHLALSASFRWIRFTSQPLKKNPRRWATSWEWWFILGD